jgi:hypothetical protein
VSASHRHLLLILAAIAGLTAPAAAQQIRGEVVLSDGATRAPGVVVVVSDLTGTSAGRALTNDRGEFELTVPKAGWYSVRLLRIGFRPTLLPNVDVPATGSVTVSALLGADPVSLARVTVRTESRCRTNADTGQLVAQLWQQARTALTAAQITTAARRLAVRWTLYDRFTTKDGAPDGTPTVTEKSGSTERPFVSLPAEALSQLGYVVEERGAANYFAPDADVLLSDAFASAHCFRVVAPPSGQSNLVGVGFGPVDQQGESVKEIEGTLWLDRANAELRALDFRYTNLSEPMLDAGAGGRVEFTRLATGNWIVSRWEIRVPRLKEGLAKGPRNTFQAEGVRTLVVGSIHLTGGEVNEVLHNGRVLFAGRSSIPGAAAAAVVAAAPQLTPDQELERACGVRAILLGEAFVEGTVLDAAQRPVPEARVSASWLQSFVAIGEHAIITRSVRADATVDDRGRFHLCGVPRDVALVVRATAGDLTGPAVALRVARDRVSASAPLTLTP